jgi:hypothetical protein
MRDPSTKLDPITAPPSAKEILKQKAKREARKKKAAKQAKHETKATKTNEQLRRLVYRSAEKREPSHGL